jgi:glycosyltransferase involved in cell wall biosynthesis
MMMTRKPKLLFIHTAMHSTFKTDIEILNKDFEVVLFKYNTKKDVFKLMKAIRRTELNMSRFVLGYATLAVLLSRMLFRKSIVVAEGWGVVSMPEIGYGAVTGKKRIKKTKYALKHASCVVAVSESLKKDAQKLVNREIKVIYHGLDSKKFKPHGEKKNMVVTVGMVRKDTLRRKGLKAFVESAKYLPDTEFLLIGKSYDNTMDHLKSIASKNVKFTGFVPDEKLLEYYQKATVYVQVSAHEGFGISLAEAMLCECVPVVTNRGAISEVVGEAGYYVPFDDAKATAEAIGQALNSKKGSQARMRIKNNFSLEKRESKLNNLIWEVIGKKST